jgi:hypothetical protein
MPPSHKWFDDVVSESIYRFLKTGGKAKKKKQHSFLYKLAQFTAHDFLKKSWVKNEFNNNNKEKCYE